MSEWLYSVFGQTKGPVSESKLISMILKEELELDSYIMNTKDEMWKKVRDVQHILDKIHEPEKAIPNKIIFSPDFMTDGKEIRVGNLYFYIPIQRLLIMNLFSLGMYQIYWFYKQWSYWSFKHRRGYLSPDREMGWILFPWTMWQKIETDKELNAVIRSDFNGTLLFWAWMGFGLFLDLLLLGTGTFGKIYSGCYLFTGMLDVVFLIPIQRYINRVNDQLGNKYDKPGIGHYLCLAVGVAVLLAVTNMHSIWKLFQV